MRNTWLGRAAIALALALAVAACGGGSSGPGNDPATTVKNAMNELAAGHFDKLADYACAAQKDTVAKQFDFSSLMAGSLSQYGVTADDVKNAIKISFSGLDAKETSRSGDTAEVALSGKVKVEVDSAKFKDIIKKAAGNAGAAVTDAQIDLILGQMGSVLSQEQDLSTTTTVVQEGGKWLICE